MKTPQNPAPWPWKRIFRWCLQALALGAVAMVAVLFLTVSEETWEHLSALSPRVFIWLCLAVLIAWVANTLRIYFLSRSLGHPVRLWPCFLISLSTDFGVAATPSGMGGTVIRVALLKVSGMPVPRGATLLAVQTAMDVLFFLLLLPAAIVFLVQDPALQRLQELLDGISLVLVPLTLGASVFALWLFFKARLPEVWFQRFGGLTAWGRRRRGPARLRMMARQINFGLERMRAACRQLYRTRQSALWLDGILAAVQWSARYSLLPIILAAYIQVPILPMFVLQGFLMMIGTVLVLPGGGGGIEVTTAVVLNQMLPLPLVGVVLLLWRIFSYHFYLLAGGLAFFHICRRLDRLFPRHAETP